MKLKRIFAMIGVILLALMYLSTLIFSLMKGEMDVSLFKASVYCTLIIPIFLYMSGMFYRYFQNKGEEMREEMKQAQARDPEKSEEDL